MNVARRTARSIGPRCAARRWASRRTRPCCAWLWICCREWRVRCVGGTTWGLRVRNTSQARGAGCATNNRLLMRPHWTRHLPSALSASQRETIWGLGVQAQLWQLSAFGPEGRSGNHLVRTSCLCLCLCMLHATRRVWPTHRPHRDRATAKGLHPPARSPYTSHLRVVNDRHKIQPQVGRRVLPLRHAADQYPSIVQIAKFKAEGRGTGSLEDVFLDLQFHCL